MSHPIERGVGIPLHILIGACISGLVLLEDQPELLADMKVYAVEVVLVSLHCSLGGSFCFVVLEDLPSLAGEELVVLSAEFLVHARV
jgi:hypothetical protein